MASAALDEAGEYGERCGIPPLPTPTAGYSDAFSEVRKDFIKTNFIWLLLAAAAVIVGIVLLTRLLKRRFARANAYETSALERKYTAPLFTLFHPIDGFDGIKRRKGWSVGLAFGMLTALFLSLTASWFLTGFSFNFNRASDYNVFITLLQAYGVAIVWVIANWAVCTLIEGKGRLIDIFGTTVYALLPFILSILVCVLLSNVMTQEEAAFLTFIRIFGIAWSGVLVFTGFMSIHQFSFSNGAFHPAHPGGHRHNDLPGDPVCRPDAAGGQLYPIHLFRTHYHDVAKGGGFYAQTDCGRCWRGCACSR